jgi:hypothetical protein
MLLVPTSPDTPPPPPPITSSCLPAPRQVLDLLIGFNLDHLPMSLSGLSLIALGNMCLFLVAGWAVCLIGLSHTFDCGRRSGHQVVDAKRAPRCCCVGLPPPPRPRRVVACGIGVPLPAQLDPHVTGKKGFVRFCIVLGLAVLIMPVLTAVGHVFRKVGSTNYTTGSGGQGPGAQLCNAATHACPTAPLPAAREFARRS